MAKLPEKIGVSIVYQNADEVPIQHANCFFVTHTDDEFFITFAQAHPPYKIQFSKEEIEELKKSGMRANIVARIMVSPTRMKEFLDCLNENYEKFTRIRKD